VVASSLHLQVLTPAETLLQVEEADWVHVRLADGAGISIYPGHAPLLAETITASVRYTDASGDHGFDVRAGILKIEDNRVTVFTSGESEPARRPAPPTTSEERQFDRLARDLRARLEEEDWGMLESDREAR
jgi:F0F1-type ATP synthase epsilon subunit